VARVVVLRGGHSMERDVSFLTGRRVQHALERLGHDVHPLDIEDSTTGALIEISPDAAFVCLHGPGGEDGTVQALLETLGIPYTGSGPLSSIRCMDKDYAKRALRAAGIQSPPFRTFLRRAMNEMGASAALDVAAEELGYPLVVKPAREGSSFGLSRVEGQMDCSTPSTRRSATTPRSCWSAGLRGRRSPSPSSSRPARSRGRSGSSRSVPAKVPTTSRRNTPPARRTSPYPQRYPPKRRPASRRRRSSSTRSSAAPASPGWILSSRKVPHGSWT
jgi:hypothetical protein